MVRIVVDDDRSAGYECKRVVRYCVSWWLWPLAKRLPAAWMGWLVTGTSLHMEDIVRYRRTHRALALIYNWSRSEADIPGIHRPRPERHWYNKAMACIWEAVVVSGAAARNRFRHVKQLTRAAIEAAPPTATFTILSLGSGSAQAVIETMAEVRSRCPERKVTLHAVDRSALARRDCLALAAGLGIPAERVRVAGCNIRKLSALERVLGEYQYDEIEVVGFSEYHDGAWLVELSRLLCRHLRTEGMLLLNNARRGRESWFTEEVLRWHLEFKEPWELGRILVDAGFAESDVEVIGEPTGIFWMAKGVRRAEPGYQSHSVR